MRGVHFRAAQIRIEVQRQGDVLAQNGRQKPRHLGDQSVQVEHLGLQHLFAPEGQELARQGGRPVGGLYDFIEHLAQWIVGIEMAKAMQRKCGMATDDREQVVEIVGHATREATDGLYRASIAQRFLSLFAPGDLFPQFLVGGDDLFGLKLGGFSQID